MTNDNPLETRNLAFYTTNCNQGTGKGVVIRIGDETVIGRIAGLTTSTGAVETPIHKEIGFFFKIIVALSICGGVIAFIWGIFLFSISVNVISVIGVIVAFVPEV